MAVNAYLNFNGNCREAVTFYADVFATQAPTIMTYGEQDHGFPMPEETKNLVMHTELTIMGSKVMFSDVPDGMGMPPLVVGNNVTLTLVSDDKAALRAAFDKLKEGGNIVMDLQETFWSALYGNVIDKYGIGWQISHETAQQIEDCPASNS